MAPSRSSRLFGRSLGQFAIFSVIVWLASGICDAGAAISNTRHNLGVNATAASKNKLTVGTDEICVFCHTPHGASSTTAAPPLWNKNLQTVAATYTTYASLGSVTIDAPQILSPVGSVSVACLSCHDGTQAMDNLINAPGSGGGDITGGGPLGLSYTWSSAVGTTADADGKLTANIAGGGTSVTKLGTDLTNDHPIGLEYCGGFTIPGDLTTCRDPNFKVVVRVGAAGASNAKYYVDANSNGVMDKNDMILYTREFLAQTTPLNAPQRYAPSVECGSCHDPHMEAVDTNQVAFLRKTQANSALCLACHTK